MSEETPTTIEETEALLNRLQEAHWALTDAITESAPKQFEREDRGGDSMKRILERSADDVNFYYGRLVARALSLPQPPDIETADFGSLEEAKASLQMAHRRLAKLLHDLTAADLDRKTRLESTGDYTLRQVLETAIAHYKLRADQLIKIRKGVRKERAADDPHNRGQWLHRKAHRRPPGGRRQEPAGAGARPASSRSAGER